MEEVLAAWGVPVVIGPLSGGNRNAVIEIHLNGRRLAARRSARPAAGPLNPATPAAS
jgi:hypothetical protein